MKRKFYKTFVEIFARDLRNDMIKPSENGKLESVVGLVKKSTDK